MRDEQTQVEKTFEEIPRIDSINSFRCEGKNEAEPGRVVKVRSSGWTGVSEGSQDVKFFQEPIIRTQTDKDGLLFKVEPSKIGMINLQIHKEQPRRVYPISIK